MLPQIVFHGERGGGNAYRSLLYFFFAEKYSCIATSM
jgi:hypothetical protein